MRIFTTLIILLTCLPPIFCQYWESATDGYEPAKLIESDSLDKSLMDVVYHHITYDPRLRSEKESYEILQIGKNYSIFSDYGYYRLDSTICASKNKIITCRQWYYLSQQYNTGISGFVIKDYQKQDLTVFEKVFIDHYLYNEPQPEFQWELIDSTSTICGHLCHKATTIFRGRKWIAWYCYDIPSDNGPWKFGGLPGIILSIHDTRMRHQFNAILTRQGHGTIAKEKRSYIRTTREKTREAMKYFINNSHTMFEGMVWNADGTPAELPKTRLFYSPIELQ